MPYKPSKGRGWPETAAPPKFRAAEGLRPGTDRPSVAPATLLPMTDHTTTAPRRTDWHTTRLGSQPIPVHCGRLAYDIDLGEWECAWCDDRVHVRDIPDWPHPARAPR